MNRLWPKLSTSIRPKTSVRPDAAMKTIIPIARPARVSVSQVDDEPTSGHATSASTATSTSGRASNAVFGTASVAAAAWPVVSLIVAPAGSLVRRQRQAEEALLQRLVAGELGHRPAMDDAAIVHHRNVVAEGLR